MEVEEPGWFFRLSKIATDFLRLLLTQRAGFLQPGEPPPTDARAIERGLGERSNRSLTWGIPFQ
jgi:methionyl-tRNA synthetase